jgi:hypothetical protein
LAYCQNRPCRYGLHTPFHFHINHEAFCIASACVNYVSICWKFQDFSGFFQDVCISTLCCHSVTVITSAFWRRIARAGSSPGKAVRERSSTRFVFACCVSRARAFGARSSSSPPRLYYFLRKIYHILRSDAQKSAKTFFLLREYSLLFFKFYVRSYIRTFLSFRMYYRIPTPSENNFLSGLKLQSWVRVGLPVAKQYYQNLLIAVNLPPSFTEITS